MLYFTCLLSLKRVQMIRKNIKLEGDIEIPCEIDPLTNKIGISSNLENFPTLITHTGKIELPEMIQIGKKKHPLVKIGENAFAYSNVTELYLPSSIYAIGKGAFSYSTKLEKIDMSQCNINMLNDKLFYCCYSLYDVQLPLTITTIGDLAFFSTGIQNFTIPSNVKHINSGVFCNCSDLESIDLDKENRFYSFDGSCLTCKGKGILVSILSKTKLLTIPSNVLYLGRYSCAFSNLQEIKISSQIVEIQDFAFAHCQHLTNIEFSQGSLNEIGRCAFKGARLSRMTLPRSLSLIHEKAFSMSTLRAVDLSDTQITTLKSFTFDDCYSLVVVALPNCLSSIEGNAFYGSGVEKIIYCGDFQFDVEFIKKGAFIVCEKKVGMDEL